MSKNIGACLSHNTDNWRTPTKIYNYFINVLGCVDCFPYCSDYDELKNDYFDNKLFINPPFSKMSAVVDWALKQYKDNNCEVYLLIPSRTDTKYFHKLLSFNPLIFFVKGRLKFNDSNSAPFPSMLVYLNHKYYGSYRTIDEVDISYE